MESKVKRFKPSSVLLLAATVVISWLAGFATERWKPQLQPRAASAPAVVRTNAPLPERLDSRSSERIRQRLKLIAHDIGVRPAGSHNEAKMAAYAKQQFESCGYQVTVQPFPLPDGKTSQNVIARKPAASRQANQPILVLGAHVDTKPTTPGASDNASGVALLLELARVLAPVSSPHEILFIAFGAEEIIDGNPDHHHYGSRYYVKHLHETRNLTMLSLDMIGIGTTLHVSRLGRPCSVRLVRALHRIAREQNVPVTANTAPEWSDHEPFEKANVPAAWLHWEKNPHYHRPGDTYEKMDVGKIVNVGNVVLSYLREQKEKKVTFAAVGDVLPEPAWRPNSPPLSSLMTDVRDQFFAADVAFANLESPLTTFPLRTPYKSDTSLRQKRNWVFKAQRPDAATGLAESGITLVSLANNHSLDYQASGLRETMKKLDAAGVLWAGAGENNRAAFAPTFVTVGGTTFACIAASHSSSTPSGYDAKPDRFGVADADDLPMLLQAVKQARPQADVVAVSLHWGIERQPFPERWQRDMAHRIVEAGADLVIGHHPHVLQGVERYKGKLIFYSLGNFVFDSVPSRWHSAMAFITYDPQRKNFSLKMLPVRIYPFGRVALATGNDALEIQQQLFARSAPLNQTTPRIAERSPPR